MEDKIYAVIDTNVLVSTFYSKDGSSNPALVINAVVDGYIIPVFNKDILAEYEEVLNRDHFNFPKVLVDYLLKLFIDSGIESSRMAVIDENFPDPSDIVFYEVKMSIEDSFLVTGNKRHYPQKPFVVTPKEMVEILRDRKILPSP